MEISISKIGNLFTAVKELAEIKFPARLAWSVYKMLSELEEKAKFVGEQEIKIVESFDGTIKEDGTIELKNKDNVSKFIDEINKLHEDSLVFDFEKLEMSLDELGDCKIKPETVAILSEIIAFN